MTQEEKINIAELLKNCPSGMALDCAIYENVTLVSIQEGYDYPIIIETPNGQMLLSKYGCFSKNELAKCVIFPKGKTTWEGFVPPCEFKDGDIIFIDAGCTWISIFQEKRNGRVATYVDYSVNGNYCYCGIEKNTVPLCMEDDILHQRLATEEEKARLFQAINDKGYEWNVDTKTLEKVIQPKFKVGDKVIHSERGGKKLTINGVYKTLYGVEEFDYGIPIENQDEYELVPDKFDVTTLKPLQPLLVRDTNGQVWTMDLFSHKIDTNKKLRISFACVGHYPNQCIPYEGNEHLLGTTNDCDNFFKTW